MKTETDNNNSLGSFLNLEMKSGRLPLEDANMILKTFCSAAQEISHLLSNMSLDPHLRGKATSTNSSGDGQKKMDLVANDIYIDAFRACPIVGGMVSEEEEDIIIFDYDKDRSTYLILIDPIDGSNNMEINHPVGTIFSILKKKSSSHKLVEVSDFLQCGTEQVGAGYFMFSFSDLLVFTVGDGVHEFVYRSSVNDWILSSSFLKIPQEGTHCCINEGDYENFESGLKSFLKSCKNKRDTDFNLTPLNNRSAGACFADFHRCLYLGGIFILPSTAVHPNGKLRLLYECNPLAFLIEQSGGKAIDGKGDIIQKKAISIHEKSPIFIGSSPLVEDIFKYLENE